MVIAKRIVPDKTRNFAVTTNTRTNTNASRQRYSIGKNKKVVIQTVSIPIPVYVDVEYKIKIKTEYQQQINDLTTPFITRTGQINAFTLKRKGHIYEAFIQQSFAQSNNVSTLGEDLREFTTEITINVLGYLIGDGDNQDRPIARIDESIVEFQFPRESVAPDGFLDIK